MDQDERAIRDLVANWLKACKAGDLETQLSLLADDVVFMLPGREPFRKEAFAARSGAVMDVDIDAQCEIQEIKVLGDWAWMRNRLRVTITPPAGMSYSSSGYTLTIVRKNPGGKWVIARDANLLAREADGAKSDR